jgi:hypothetical protein
MWEKGVIFIPKFVSMLITKKIASHNKETIDA